MHYVAYFIYSGSIERNDTDLSEILFKNNK